MAVKGSSGNAVVSLDDFISSNTRDDGIRDAGLVTPKGIRRFDNISYGTDARNLLDVYRPKDVAGKLPVIVSVHGGGWVYGSKELMQYYCMSLAERGFAVVNFSYRLAPKHKHPIPFADTNSVFCWVLDHADHYGFDVDNIFAVGDSVGANILGLYCCMCTDLDYQKKMSVYPPKGFLPKALGLNCGLYRMARGEVDVVMDNLAAAYFPGGGTDEEYDDICLVNHLNKAFPPSFIMTAEGDFLASQAKPFYEKLRSLGVRAEYHYYGDTDHALRHVFHVDMKLAAAKQCNDDECAFFLKEKERDAGGGLL